VSFLIGFYRRHPGMRANKLFLIGVSYGGHYATLLARAILQYNKMYAVAKQLPLAGVSVQNAWMDPYYDNRGSVEAWYGAGLIERATRDGLLACDLANGVLWRTEGANNLTKPCAALRDRAYKEAGEQGGGQARSVRASTCVRARTTVPRHT
jgi:Serine carboxypeptidase